MYESAGYLAHGTGALDPEHWTNQRGTGVATECARCGEPAYDSEFCDECLEELEGDADDE